MIKFKENACPNKSGEIIYPNPSAPIMLPTTIDMPPRAPIVFFRSTWDPRDVSIVVPEASTPTSGKATPGIAC